MYHHPDFALAHAHDRRRELTARADRYRLAAVFRRRNRVAVTATTRGGQAAPRAAAVAAAC